MSDPSSAVTEPSTTRARTGALLGAVVGPPALILVIHPRIAAGFPDLRTSTDGALYVVATLGCWAVGVVGVPLLGASAAAGRWIGRDLAKRLANHLIGGALAGGAISALFLWRVTARRGSDPAAPFRVVIADVALVCAVLLCFRGRLGRPAA